MDVGFGGGCGRMRRRQLGATLPAGRASAAGGLPTNTTPLASSSHAIFQAANHIGGPCNPDYNHGPAMSASMWNISA